MPRKPSRPVDAEIQHHLDECTDLLVEQGMSLQDARREARRRFGNVPHYQSACETIMNSVDRDTRRAETLHALWQDLTYAMRGIRRNPMFAAGLILTLGLGIGANTAIFTVADAIMLRPLPYQDPASLVTLQPFSAESQSASRSVPVATAQAWTREARFVDDLALYTQFAAVRSGTDVPQFFAAQAVSANLATVLGVAPVLGRWFVPDDMIPGAPRVAVLGHHKWLEWFAGDANVLGQTLVVDDAPYMVIGVMPPDFRFPTVNGSSLYVPLRGGGYASVVGRLADGVSLADAQARADLLADAMPPLEPGFADYDLIRISPLDDWVDDADVEQALWTLVAAVALMWLIAIGNGVNLLSVRASTRTREMALRLSLGASRARLLRQLLTESVLLSLFGGVAAMLLARLSLATIVQLIPESVVLLATNQIVFDGRVVWFAFGLSTLTGLLVGIVPAVRLLRPGGSTSVSATDLHGAAKRQTAATRRALVVAQVALSMTLLVGAGLVINSFNRLVRVDPGFDADRLVYLALSLPVSAPEYGTPEQWDDFYDRLVRRLAAVPGVSGVAVADGVPPYARSRAGARIATETGSTSAEQPLRFPQVIASDTYFDVLGIPLVRGRTFAPGDDAGAVIIDEDLARSLWGDEDPIGMRFRIDAGADLLTVIGVAGDVKLAGLDDRRGTLAMYRPLVQMRPFLSLAVRTEGDPAVVLPLVRDAVWALDPDLPFVHLATAAEDIAASVDGARFLVTLLSVAAAVALVLVAIGVYGVLAFAVSQRTRELGVRIALGATSDSVRRMVLRDGLVLAGVGVALGLAGAMALSRVMKGLLFNVEPTDPLTLGAVSAVMLTVAGIACYLPARRATGVDPMIVLRAE